ncbi:hypothetical protein EDD11_001895 [Mortierella claussenii]|nr:hypothetical protein EDD11_001895 [Mortierella claussenii]
MSFTIETILDTKEPYTIEFLGPPSATVQHDISGTLHLHVQKAVQLKQLSVAFVGEGDLASTFCAQLKSESISWTYNVVTSAVPSGLFVRRKVIYQPFKLKRVHVLPSDSANVRYGAKRPGSFECAMYAPKIVCSGQRKIQLSVFLHSFSQTHRVCKITVHAVQKEKITFDPTSITRFTRRVRSSVPLSSTEVQHVAEESNPHINTDTAKSISQTIVVLNPDQEEFTTEWGREAAVEIEMEIDTKEIIPSEKLRWVKIDHGIRFTIVFADPTIRPLVVMLPFQVVNILEELWSLQSTPDGLTPPDYGAGDHFSTLLDSNTTRLNDRQQLYREIYPEREPIVPDLANDLPPVYGDDEEQPMPYSEKQTL